MFLLPTLKESLSQKIANVISDNDARPALFVGQRYYTYAELGNLSKRFAATLAEASALKFSSTVGILSNRSVTSFAAVLGALSSGRCFVPINNEFPASYIKQILSISSIDMLIAGTECIDRLREVLEQVESTLAVVLPCDAAATDLQHRYPNHRFFGLSSGRTDNVVFKHKQPELAYILFSSGTTGMPKAIPISRSNLESYVASMSVVLKLRECDRVSQYFSHTFDLSMHDIFITWVAGACLYCLPPAAVLSPARFISKYQLSVWFSVPSAVPEIARAARRDGTCFDSLRLSMFCGEPLTVGHVEAFAQVAPHAQIMNLYGPTEATIAATLYTVPHRISLVKSMNGIVCIGRPLASVGYKIRRDDVYNNDVGELLLSGPQVFDGYMNGCKRDEFFHIEGSKFFGTKDLVTVDNDGDMYFRGRADNQVKHRGYRLEIEGIEAISRSVFQTDDLFVVCSTAEGIGPSTLAIVSVVDIGDAEHKIRELERRLPAYMVPRKVVRLERVPRNSNGKVDRKKLLEECRKSL